MKKNISIAVALLFAFGGVGSAIAQTDGTTSVDATVTTTSVSPAPTGVDDLPPKRPLPPTGVRPAIRDARAELESRGVRKDTRDMRGEIRDVRGDLKDMRGDIKGSREEMEARVKELRASSTAVRANIKDEQQKKRLELARKQTEMINKRLEAAIGRVQKLSNRVSERLAKLEADGVDVTVSREHIAEAKTKLDEALTKAAAVKLAIEIAFASATPKDAMKDVQEAVRDAAKTIQEAHRHVALAISTVKPGLNKPRPATTRPAVVAPVDTTTSTTPADTATATQ
ncbi:MAG: hypothetical protein HZB10_00230 [Candidatus Yonathbacteria bacterium]|nr:hypothetical protein [Candidatus Yonathbacteria bacterium]